MHVLGIDIGGSAIKGAVVHIQTASLSTERFKIKTPSPATPDAVLGTIEAITHHFSWTGPVGIGFPGVIEDQHILTATNLDPDWIGLNIQDAVHKNLGMKSWTLNDADAAGIAEIESGSGAQIKGTIIVITIGTGLGSSVFHQGQLIPNTELGKIEINGQHAEHLASSASRKKEQLNIDQWAHRFNHYLKQLYTLFTPELFILGGGITNKPETFMHLLKSTAKIKIANHQNNAGILGAAIIAQKNIPTLGLRQGS